MRKVESEREILQPKLKVFYWFEVPCNYKVPTGMQ